MKDKISVIIPVYNIKDYIDRAVKSVLTQTHKNIEIILVDDGSTDGSSDLLDQLSLLDERIKVFHKENGGVTDARLYGAAKATGDWVGFIDGDDIVDPDMYKKLLSNAKKYKADISHCGYQMCFPDRTDFYYNTGKLLIQDHETALMDLVEGKFIEPSLCNKLFRRDLSERVLQNCKLDKNVHYMEDLLMNYYLFKDADITVYEDFCPYHYIVRKGSAVKKKLNKHKLLDPLLVYKTIRADTVEKKMIKVVNERIAGCLINISSMRIGDINEEWQIHCNRARKELLGMRSVIIKGKYGKVFKIKVLLASSTPGLYRIIQKVYGEITGNKYKYDINR